MQCIVTYATDKYYLSKIISEISVFNFGCLTSGHSIYSWARMWGSMVIFRSQKRSASGNVCETLA